MFPGVLRDSSTRNVIPNHTRLKSDPSGKLSVNGQFFPTAVYLRKHGQTNRGLVSNCQGLYTSRLKCVGGLLHLSQPKQISFLPLSELFPSKLESRSRSITIYLNGSFLSSEAFHLSVTNSAVRISNRLEALISVSPCETENRTTNK